MTKNELDAFMQESLPKNIKQQKLDIQKTLETATTEAIKSPQQDLKNVLEVIAGRVVGVNTMAHVSAYIENWDELFDLFTNEENLARIEAGRDDFGAVMDKLQDQADMDPKQQAIDKVLENYGLVWAICKPYPFYDITTNIPDGSYVAEYAYRGWGAGNLTKTGKLVRIEDGKINVEDVCKVFGKEFAKKDDHVFIEDFNFQDEVLMISTGS